MEKKEFICQLYKALFKSLVVIFLAACVSNDEPALFDCDLSDLSISVASTTNASGCAGNDGQVAVAASGGQEPYQFSVNGGPFGNQSAFTSLAPGTYTIVVRDFRNCESSIQAIVNADGSDLSAQTIIQPDTECLNDNGSVTINVNGGTPPYQYRLGNQSFNSNNQFTNLKNGSYTFTVRDADNCSIGVNAVVPRGDTGVSFSGVIKNIIDTRCAIATCHVSGTGRTNLSVFSNVQSNAQNIKSRTASKSMPPPGSTQLTDEQIALIACWVDDGAKNN